MTEPKKEIIPNLDEKTTKLMEQTIEQKVAEKVAQALAEMEKNKNAGRKKEIKLKDRTKQHYFKVKLRDRAVYNGVVRPAGEEILVKGYDKDKINDNVYEFIEDLGLVSEYKEKQIVEDAFKKQQMLKHDLEIQQKIHVGKA
jgi:hypothetical protein